MGYAGGQELEPTYHNIGAHAEALRVVYDPAVLSYAELLRSYASWHTPYRVGGQYRSVLFPRDDEQSESVQDYLDAIEDTAQRPYVIEPGGDESIFWDAEDYHQKYRLRSNRRLVALLEQELGERWDESSIATKLNAAVRGRVDIKPWLEQLSPNAEQVFRSR